MKQQIDGTKLKFYIDDIEIDENIPSNCLVSFYETISIYVELG